MKFIYPAVFRKTETGTYEASFPDLAGCHAHGDTLEDAVEDASEAVLDWISVEMEEETPHFPPVTDIRDIETKENETVRNIAVTYRFYDGWEE